MPALLLSGALPVLAETDFVEHEEQRATQARRDQRNRERLPDHALDQGRAKGSGDDQQAGRPKGDYSVGHSGGRFSRKAEIPSCASATIEFVAMTVFVRSYAPGSSSSTCR